MFESDTPRTHLRKDNHGRRDESGVQEAVAHVVSRLRGEGQRLTPQRLLLIELLVERGDHVTADELYTAACRRYPFLNVSTVYRTLETLRDAGIVSETDLGNGRRHFALLSEDVHHHAICLDCGDVMNIDDRLFEGVRRGLHDEHGFAARIEHIAIFGVCQACLQSDDRVAGA